MEQEVKITAHLEPASPTTCRLAVERPIYPEGSAYFATRESAKGSPLAEKLFEIEGVTAVRIAGGDVSITKPDVEDWRPVAGRVAEIIRAHMHSGARAVSEAFQSTRLPDSAIMAKVQEVFDTRINPAVAQHGGQVELLDVKASNVYIRMGGGCQGCGMANVTLRQGIETAIRERVPQVDQILDVTDHASGTNPYYAPSQK